MTSFTSSAQWAQIAVMSAGLQKSVDVLQFQFQNQVQRQRVRQTI